MGELYKQLKSKKIILAPYSEKFVTSTYVGWLNNKNVTKYSEQRHKIHTLESCEYYRSSMKQQKNPYYAILLNDDSQMHVGNISAQIDYNNRVADLSILLGESKVWGQGIGTEAWLLLMNYLISSKAIRKISAGTMANNVGMLNIIKRAGMHLECVKLRHFLQEGNEIDLMSAYKFANEGVAVTNLER